MNPLSIFQAAAPLPPATKQIMIAVFVAIFIALVLASRRAKREPTQTAAYNARTGRIFSVILIVWGGAIWLAILMTQRYNNLLAIVAASSLLSIGMYYLFKGLRKRGGNGAGAPSNHRPPPNDGMHPTRVSVPFIVNLNARGVVCGRVMPGVRPLQ